jgi:hypothetical protein
MAPRTARDYLRDAEILKKGLGHIPAKRLEAKHVAKFRDERAQDAPSHVRNEMACLSAALSWALEAGTIERNVAMDVRRPRKMVRERLISDDEYLTIYDRAQPSVQLAMVLVVRTLGLPADVLKLGTRNLVKNGELYTLRFRRGKTKVPVELEVVGELAIALAPFLNGRSLHPTFVRRDDGKPYTVDGIGAMFRRYCVGDVIPEIRSVMIWSPILPERDRTNEEALHGRTDHWLSAGWRSWHCGEGFMPQARIL